MTRRGTQPGVSAGGGGGTVQAASLGGLSSADFYEASSSAHDPTGDFTVCVMARIDTRPAAYEPIFARMDGFNDGWSLEYDSNTLRFRIGTGAGNATVSWVGYAGTHDRPTLMKTALMHGLYNSATDTMELYINGHSAGTNSPVVYSAPAGTTQSRVGAVDHGAFDFPDGRVFGAAYIGTLLTSDDVRSHTQECFNASNMVDGVGFSWDNLYIVSSGAVGAPATWPDENGSEPLTRNGFPNEVSTTPVWL